MNGVEQTPDDGTVNLVVSGGGDAPIQEIKLNGNILTPTNKSVDINAVTGVKINGESQSVENGIVNLPELVTKTELQTGVEFEVLKANKLSMGESIPDNITFESTDTTDAKITKLKDALNALIEALK